MHSSTVCTARSLTYPVVYGERVYPTPLHADHPGCRPRLDAKSRWRPPSLDVDPSGYRPSDHVTSDACWEANTPSGGQNECYTVAKILPCSKLRCPLKNQDGHNSQMDLIPG